PAAAEQDHFAQRGLELLHEFCFRAGTLVLTAEGAKAIEDVRVGDVVACVDDKNPNGPLQWKCVDQVFHNAPAELLNVHIGTGVIGTTFNHPWYAIGRGWVAAAELQIGDLLRMPEGSTATVTDLFANGDIEPVFNLRVADNHTYFVGTADGC